MEKSYRKILLSVIVIVTILAIALYSYKADPVRKFNGYVTEQNYQSAVDIYNEKIVGTQFEEHSIAIFENYIDEVVTNWENNDKEYNDTVISLQLMESVSTAVVSEKATAKLEYIYIEHDGYTAYKQALELKDASKYSQCMAIINTVNEKYSQYETMLELYVECKDSILSLVGSPTTASEYESAIQLLEECLVNIDEDDFKSRKTILENELAIIKDIASILEKAALKAVEGDYAQLFNILENGQKKYPLAKEISEVLEQYHDLFIIETSVKAMQLCEEYDYEAAEKIVTDALSIYESDDLQIILLSIQEDKKPLNKIRNITKDKCNELVKTLEDSGTIDYISTSLEKLAFGDYSEEESTLLSTSATVAASLVNADLPMDIRDLAHCITNPEAHTAADYVINTLALVPVIGSIKYLDDFIPMIKTADKASDVSDTAKDVAKNTPVEAISTFANKVKKDATKFINKYTKEAEEIASQCAKYVGKVYPGTNVKIKSKKVALSDGRVIKGAFPIFDSKININLPDDLLKKTADKQKEFLNSELIKKATTEKGLKELQKTFSKEEIDLLKQGILPSGYTWHHNEEEGLMQLVDSVTHAAVKHTGGMSIWGKGY